MAAVVVAGTQPLYELGAADLVVRQLDELSMINLKQLFRNEAHVEGGAVRTPPCGNTNVWSVKGLGCVGFSAGMRAGAACRPCRWCRLEI